MPRKIGGPRKASTHPTSITDPPCPRTPAPSHPLTAFNCAITLCILSLIFLASPLPAEEPAATTSEPAAAEPESTAAPVADAREEEKQRRAMAGLLALCGILIGGLMFVVLVMVWGARLRRLARRELPAQKTLQNELWFLKPPKSPPE